MGLDIEKIEALHEFWDVNKFPLVGLCDGTDEGGRNYLKYSGRRIHGVKAGTIWVMLPMEAGIEGFEKAVAGQRDLLKKVGKYYRKQHSLIVVDTGDEAFGGVLKSIFGRELQFPAIGLVQYNEEERYKHKLLYSGELDFTKITTWFDDMVAKGVMTNVQKSEPIPETNDGPVRIIVGKTWEREIYQPFSLKDTILEVYAPWCPYCQK